MKARHASEAACRARTAGEPFGGLFGDVRLAAAHGKHDSKARRVLWQWLGDEGCALDDRGAVQVSTPFGPVIARPGDWIVLSHNGQYHVARASNAWDA